MGECGPSEVPGPHRILILLRPLPVAPSLGTRGRHGSWGGEGGSELPQTCPKASSESTCRVGGLGLSPGSGRFPGEGTGNPLQYACLRNSMHRGAWRATSMGSRRVRHGLVTAPPQGGRTKWGAQPPALLDVTSKTPLQS